MPGYTKEYVEPIDFDSSAEDVQMLLRESYQSPPQNSDFRRKYRLLNSSQNKGLPNPLKSMEQLEHRPNIRHSESSSKGD